jgi:hypothetical protein
MSTKARVLEAAILLPVIGLVAAGLGAFRPAVPAHGLAAADGPAWSRSWPTRPDDAAASASYQQAERSAMQALGRPARFPTALPDGYRVIALLPIHGASPNDRLPALRMTIDRPAHRGVVPPLILHIGLGPLPADDPAAVQLAASFSGGRRVKVVIEDTDVRVRWSQDGLNYRLDVSPDAGLDLVGVARVLDGIPAAPRHVG